MRERAESGDSFPFGTLGGIVAIGICYIGKKGHRDLEMIRFVDLAKHWKTLVKEKIEVRGHLVSVKWWGD